jgi:hypothetical protein
MSGSELGKGTVCRGFVAEIEDPKDKIFIMVGYDPDDKELKSILINSRLTKFISRNLELKKLQIYVDPNDYSSFLDHASYICCTTIISIDIEKFFERMRNGKARIVGQLTEDHLKRACENIQKAKGIKGKDKKIIAQRFVLPAEYSD